MSLTKGACPEALYGQHGEPNTSGKCPYCGAQLRPRGTGTGRMETRRLFRQPAWYREERLDRRAATDLWGRVEIPAEQDPEIEPDPDSDYYDH